VSEAKNKSGRRTLLMSVLMSSPGPLIVGLGLMTGKSSTQLADFFRRSAELLAIICAFIVYCVTERDGQVDLRRKAHLEHLTNLFVGGVMCLSGIVMTVLAFFSEAEEKGNVLPGLTIAVLGVIANTLFWRKYTRLNRQKPNPILAVQARLYRAKSLVDGCVTIALTAVALFPASQAAVWLDMAGTIIVGAYLIYCGVKTVRESRAAEGVSDEVSDSMPDGLSNDVSNAVE